MVAELKGRMSLNGQPFIDTLKNVSGEIEGNFQKSLDKIGGQIAQAFTVTALVSFGKQIIDTADQAVNLAARLDASTETVQSLSIVAKEAGLSMAEVEGAMLKTSRAATEAQSGNNKLLEAFNKLGISAGDLASMNNEQIFEAVTKAMAENSQNADVLSAAYDVIGTRAGPQLKSVLIDVGQQGFEALNKSMRDSNQIMTNESIQAWDMLGDELAKATRQIQSFVGEIGGGLIGGLKTASEWLGVVSAGGNWDDYIASLDEISSKQEEINRATREKASLDKEFREGINTSISLQEKLYNEELKRKPAAERLKALKEEENELQKLANELTTLGTSEEHKKIEAKIRLLTIGDEIKKLEKEIADETGKGNEKKEKSASLAKQQLDNFNTLKNTIRGLTDRELADFLTKMQAIAYAIEGLTDIPKDKLAWVSDLAQLEFKGLTTSQADQMVRALTSLVNGIASLSGKIPSDMLDFLEDLNNLKFSGLTSGQASQMVRAIETLVNGLKALSGTDLSFITDLMESLQGATPGKYEIAISLPDEFKDGFPLVLPDGMEGNLGSIAKNLETLAGLKGVVWA